MKSSGHKTNFLRKDMNLDSDRCIVDLQKILEVNRAMTGMTDLDALLDYIRDAMVDVLRCDRCTIFMIDDETNELWCRTYHGAEMKEIRFSVGVGIAGKVAATGDTTNIPDAYSDDRFNRDIDKKTGYVTRNLLTMAMKNLSGKVIGVAQVLNKSNHDPFSEYDEMVLGSLASNAGVVLENAMLLEHFIEKQKIEHALEIAQVIQQSLLPSEPPQVEGCDLAGSSESCDEVGGDYFDYIMLEDNKLGIVIGDVTGHGVGSSLLMATARAFLLALTLGKTPKLSELFFQINNLLEHDMEDGKFMTMFMGVYDPKTAELTYVSCGHDEPAHYHAATGEFTEYDATGMPLGIMPDTEFELAGPFKLEKDDVLFLSTDGVWEAPNAESDRYGKKRLFKVLRENAGKSSAEIIKAVDVSLKKFIGKFQRKDDITMLVLKKV